jgi:hypothetical protein
MKIRLMGNADECATALTALRHCHLIRIVHVSDPFLVPDAAGTIRVCRDVEAIPLLTAEEDRL